MKEYLIKLVRKDINETLSEINRKENRWRHATATNHDDLDFQIQEMRNKITRSQEYIKRLEGMDFENNK